ncbi:MAG: hypothetical protein KF678_15120 [Phycisphaeraceae bacterium]|nr:hypothetical protein [Phycisphaeraceae bacterium]
MIQWKRMASVYRNAAIEVAFPRLAVGTPCGVLGSRATTSTRLSVANWPSARYAI